MQAKHLESQSRVGPRCSDGIAEFCEGSVLVEPCVCNAVAQAAENQLPALLRIQPFIRNPALQIVQKEIEPTVHAGGDGRQLELLFPLDWDQSAQRTEQRLDLRRRRVQDHR
ncbi:hypothetical protein D9M68_1001220 [compost metagenome]